MRGADTGWQGWCRGPWEEVAGEAEEDTSGNGLRQRLEDAQGDGNSEMERKRPPPAVDNAWKEGQWPVENNSETSCL